MGSCPSSHFYGKLSSLIRASCPEKFTLYGIQKFPQVLWAGPQVFRQSWWCKTWICRQEPRWIRGGCFFGPKERWHVFKVVIPEEREKCQRNLISFHCLLQLLTVGDLILFGDLLDFSLWFWVSCVSNRCQIYSRDNNPQKNLWKIGPFLFGVRGEEPCADHGSKGSMASCGRQKTGRLRKFVGNPKEVGFQNQRNAEFFIFFGRIQTQHEFFVVFVGFCRIQAKFSVQPSEDVTRIDWSLHFEKVKTLERQLHPS